MTSNVRPPSVPALGGTQRMGLARWKRLGAELYFALLRFVFPGDCAICQGTLGVGARSVVCGACWGGIRVLDPPFCPRCGRPFWGSTLVHPPSHRCQACRTKSPQYLLARSAVLYERDDPLRDILLLFKHGRKIALGRHLGGLMAERAVDLLGHLCIDAVVPVPLHRRREQERGFNQADILARAVARRLDRPVLRKTVQRIRPTPPQSGKPRGRARNVRGAFAVRRVEEIKDRSLLLVDDVLTTGATVNECAKVLMKAGARTVLVYTLARAL